MQAIISKKETDLMGGWAHAISLTLEMENNRILNTYFHTTQPNGPVLQNGQLLLPLACAS